MRQRCYITLGAGTDAGGKVVTASSTVSLDGVPRALEGDLIDCPNCQARAPIGCEGPRLAGSENGLRPALDGDLCLCHCQPRPRLVANQDRYRQWIADDAG